MANDSVINSLSPRKPKLFYPNVKTSLKRSSLVKNHDKIVNENHHLQMHMILNLRDPGKIEAKMDLPTRLSRIGLVMMMTSSPILI